MKKPARGEEFIIILISEEVLHIIPRTPRASSLQPSFTTVVHIWRPVKATRDSLYRHDKGTLPLFEVQNLRKIYVQATLVTQKKLDTRQA
eukprot:1158060-Pelagomonas_calceolata.AAC.10